MYVDGIDLEYTKDVSRAPLDFFKMAKYNGGTNCLIANMTLQGAPGKTTTESLCLIFMILVSLENVNKYSHVVARLPQRLKSTLIEIFSSLHVPFGHPPFEKISNNVDFSL